MEGEANGGNHEQNVATVSEDVAGEMTEEGTAMDEGHEAENAVVTSEDSKDSAEVNDNTTDKAAGTNDAVEDGAKTKEVVAEASDDSIGEISDSDDDDDGSSADPEPSTMPENASLRISDAALKHSQKDRTNRVWESSDDDEGTTGAAEAQTDMHGQDSDFLPAEEHVEEIKMSVPEYNIGEQITLVKMPNFLDIDSKPFDASTYVDTHLQDDDGARDELGRKRVKLRVENSVRWRYAMNEDGQPIKTESGEYAKESNANIITWSDGTESLVVGDQVVGFSRQDIKLKHTGLFIIAPAEEQDTPCVQAVTMFDQRAALKPYTTKSKLHEQLTRTVAVSAGIRGKIKEIQVDKNPETFAEQQKRKGIERARKEMMDRNRLERAQQAAREKSTGLTSRFLEEDYRIDYGEYGESSDEEELPVTRNAAKVKDPPSSGRAARAARRRGQQISDDESEKDEGDNDNLADSQDADSADEPSPSKKSKKRKLIVEDDDSDE